jgi:hypothetical protein
MAQDSVPSVGPLANADFYNLVACGARPGLQCPLPLVRWSAARAEDVTVSLFQTDPAYPKARRRAIQKALYAAIAQINACHAALQLHFAPEGQAADVTVHFLDIDTGDQIRGTGLDPLDGSIIQAALTQLWWNGNLELTRAAIVFPRNIEWDGLDSIALEELTQAMGLRTDIDNPWYETRSVFSETSNSVAQLGQQDIMAVQRHYPLGN